jgi:hypothetical protein
MKKSKLYSKLLIVTMALTLITSCQKTVVDPTVKPTELVSFKFDIASFTVKDGIFKNLNEDSIFSEFKHVYPELNQVWFTAKDGTTYNPELVEHYKSLDTRTFTLPVGDYTITGGSEIVPYTIESVMLYTIDPQMVTITQDTKIVPVILTPTCWLVIIADPYLQVDTAYWPNSKQIAQLLDYNWENRGELNTTAFLPYNWNNDTKSGDFRLTYAYCSMLNDPDLYVSFEKKNSDQVQIPTKDFKAGHVYRIFIDKSKTLDITPGFQVDSIQNY